MEPLTDDADYDAGDAFGNVAICSDASKDSAQHPDIIVDLTSPPKGSCLLEYLARHLEAGIISAGTHACPPLRLSTDPAPASSTRTSLLFADSDAPQATETGPTTVNLDTHTTPAVAWLRKPSVRFSGSAVPEALTQFAKHIYGSMSANTIVFVDDLHGNIGAYYHARLLNDSALDFDFVLFDSGNGPLSTRNIIHLPDTRNTNYTTIVSGILNTVRYTTDSSVWLTALRHRQTQGLMALVRQIPITERASKEAASLSMLSEVYPNAPSNLAAKGAYSPLSSSSLAKVWIVYDAEVQESPKKCHVLFSDQQASAQEYQQRQGQVGNNCLSSDNFDTFYCLRLDWTGWDKMGLQELSEAIGTT
ncbi:unnamed protein product, partial [Protopolystoma xenopodis]